MRPLSARRAVTHRLVSGPPPPFEGLPDDGGSGGGCVCFVCNRSAGNGEPIVVVSRLWQETPTGEEKMKDVIDATSSLQVCVSCTLRAAVRAVAFVHKPKLVSPELSAFYHYARAFAYGLAASRSDTRLTEVVRTSDLFALPEHDIGPLFGMARHVNRRLSVVGDAQCYRCSGSIAPGTRHMLIEIAVHSDFGRCVNLSNIWKVSKHCHSCSIQLFPVDDDDRLDPDVW
jgi:hypothetical protein